MNKYVVLELENGNKCVVIDVLKIKNNEYFLVVSLDKEEVTIKKELNLCKYNELKNYFEKIDNDKEFDFIMSIFNERIENREMFENEFDEFIELKIIDIEDNNYKFQKINGEEIIKNIEFYLNIKPKINDIIYISKKMLNEINLFYYGIIKDLNKITLDEIIKLIHDGEEYYLQRYYG